jgi:1-acyl-sn-glycerol-3-phosphate acyltransferase
MFRTFFFSIVVVIDTIVSAFSVMAIGIFNPYSKIATHILKNWARILVWAAGIKLEVVGKENIQQGTSYVVVSNHQSHMDIPTVLTAIPLAIRIISKKELFKIPVFGWGMRAAGILEIDRANRKKAIETLKRAEEIIRQNQLSILAFPEGTRSPDGKIHPFKKGPFILALNSQYAILPVSISGTRNILPKKKLKIKSGKVRVQIHSPINTLELKLNKRDDLLKSTQEVVEKGFIENYS